LGFDASTIIYTLMISLLCIVIIKKSYKKAKKILNEKNNLSLKEKRKLRRKQKAKKKYQK